MVKYGCMRIRKTRENLPLFILGLVIVFLFFGICLKQQALNARATSDQSSSEEETEQHFVTIYDNEQRTILRSDAKTVRELLDRAEISVNDGDKVEPGLDEEINANEFNINIYRARQVVVRDGLVETIISTPSNDPETIAADAGIELLAADVVKLLPYDKFLETGMTTVYQVVRAKTICLDFNGQHTTIRTQAKTVNDFLREQDIDNNPEINWVSLPGDTKVVDGLALSVYFQGKHTITIEEDIPFTERVTTDYSLDYGTRNVTQVGVPGKKSVVYDVEMHDGQILSRTFISEVVITEPVEQQVTVGMKINLPAGSHEDWMAAAGISASDYGYVNFIISHESGWRTTASNGRYYGLYQTSLGRLQSDCPNWQSDPVCQLRSASSYANGRYGSWAGAYQFWTSHNWW